MCMMDWRIGRLITWHCLGISNPTILFPQNRQRVAIQITPTDVDLSTSTDALCMFETDTGNVFYNREMISAVKLFTLAEYGSIIQRKLTLENINDGVAFYGWEAVMPESYLAAGLEQFESEYARGHN